MVLVASLSKNAQNAQKSDETAILLKKLKEAYEVKFRELELSNRNLNNEILGIIIFVEEIKLRNLDYRKEAEELSNQLDDMQKLSNNNL